MKKNLLIILVLILLIIPLKTNALNMELLRNECNPLVQLDSEGNEYYCTKSHRKIKISQEPPDDVFGNPNTETEERTLATYKDSNVCKNTGECFKGVGLMFQLIYYTGSGDPAAVGNKYHVYNPALLTDQTIANKVSLPNTAYDFRDPNKNFDLSQRLSPGDKGQIFTEKTVTNNWTEMPDCKYAVHQDGSGYTDGKGVEHPEQPPNKYLGTKDYTYNVAAPGSPEDTKVAKDYYSYQYDNEGIKRAFAHNQLTYDPEAAGECGKTGYRKYIFTYNSQYSKTTYPKTKILSPEWTKGQPLEPVDTSEWEVDSSLSESEVSSNYLKDKVTKYFARGTVAETVSAVNDKFGTRISERDLEYYYIEVQAIYRVFTDEKTKTGTFVVKDVPEIIEEEEEIVCGDASTTTSTNSTLCANRGFTYVSAGGVREYKAAVAASCSKKSTAPKDTTCSVNSDKTGCTDSTNCTFNAGSAAVSAVPSSGRCTDGCSVDSCPAKYVKYWKRSSGSPGIKLVHRILGTAYEGWSQLLYTMSPSYGTCDSDKVTTSLGDVLEQNKHCELDTYSNEYSEQEKANQCASGDKYKYYVGPDPERALVGTGSNPFNLFGSSGNRCRTGVKHYYLFDLEGECVGECSSKCQQICANAGSHDSNTYLQCAENFCDHDVDYSLGGQPFVRKKECLLSSSYCDYQYGRVPTMGDNSGNNRQSVSSCANTKLFKTGSGTSFSLEKTPYNSSSTCGYNTNGYVTGGVGKDSSCVGDTVTDYNNTDADDTAFDKRTYINIACQETESITSVGGMNEPVKAGLPISYSLNTKGQVTCVAFFNYEQWKIDYAIIPSQDIIRRNRLDYIYQKFNNLMTNGYTVSNSLTSFDAYDLDGKTMQSWTITDADGYGQVKWDDYKININNSSAKAESKETLKNGTTKNQTEDPLTDFTFEKATLSVVPSEMDLTSGVYKAYTTGDKNSGGVINSDKKLIKVANDSITTPDTGSNGNSMLVGYVQTSTDTKSYVYAKYCVNKEGKVTKADDTGVCSDGKAGNNAFYTDFGDIDSTGNADIHNIKGTVTVESSLPDSNTTIYNNADTCPINIISDTTEEDSAYCKFKIINGDSYGDKTFINGSDIEIMIEFYDNKDIRIEPDSFTITMTSPYRNETSTNKYNTLSLKSAAYKSGLEDIHFVGSFTYQGKTITPCEDDLTIIQEGNLCEVKKKGTEDKKYTVNTTVASPKAVMGGMLNQRITQRILQDMYTDDHLPSNLGRLGRPKSEDGLYKYLLDLSKSDFDSQSTVIGYVNNYDKGEFCLKPEGTPKQCVKNTKTGKGLYLPGQYAEITEYCKDNWAKDTYGYNSYASCVDTCARCPTHENEVIGWEDNAQDTQDNIKKVNDFCDAYATNGYSSKDACVSLVYERCINPGEYKYRPVNSSNPFPSAVDNASIAPGYNVGDRIIGSNWKGKEHYITEGNPSVPRYQFALTADKIKQIRSEISGDNKTSVYTQLNPMNDSSENGSYMSKYVRDDTYFRGIFCYIQGEKVSNVGGCNYE